VCTPCVEISQFTPAHGGDLIPVLYREIVRGTSVCESVCGKRVCVCVRARARKRESVCVESECRYCGSLWLVRVCVCAYECVCDCVCVIERV